MKKFFLLTALLAGFFLSYAQLKPFRFAFISDTHIGSPNGSAEEDLRRTVRDINAMTDVAFVVLTGDITELGTNEELKLAKQILDSLDIPWYIIPGNHDSGWSESGGAMFITVFGNDKFSFEYRGIRFLGCASGPYVRMGDGHVPRDAVNWLDDELKKLTPQQPVIFLNHYPIDPGLDNWYEITDRLRKHNTRVILCGHGHANKAMNFEDIPGVMGRSNLRARAATGGYNLVDIVNDSIIFTERRPGPDSYRGETFRPWTAVKIETRNYDTGKKFNRPSYAINAKYPEVKKVWEYSSAANIISTPAVANGLAIAGNQNGEIVALSLKNGSKAWTFQTGGSIFSSPAASEGKVVLGSTDGFVYCLDSRTGKLVWKRQTGAPVLGSPLITDDVLFIGGSKAFFSFELKTGKMRWSYTDLKGPVVSTPIYYKSRVLFGAWDTYLYSLNSTDGKLFWKWNNGSPVRNYSPAACIPVRIAGEVYVVAPDRYLSAIDFTDGKTLWRNNDAAVRESIGFSSDGKWVYGKTMQDTIVAYRTGREKQPAAWKMYCGFGYEHVPSMLKEKEGFVFFGTKNGVVYCIDPAGQKIQWAYKIDNSMVNTVQVMDKHSLIAATMDGKIVLLKATGY
ncbi:MAG: metallophosphoesterase [Bacteroidetes bacterium]|nr:metallophosphoesterase [Bacteroidota bacterium]